MLWKKRNRIEAKCLLCGHVTPFKSIDDVSLDALNAPHGCTATASEREEFERRLSQPGSAPVLVECGPCGAPLGWVHPDDPRAEALRTELAAGCTH